jgi:hypothetical protein
MPSAWIQKTIKQVADGMHVHRRIIKSAHVAALDAEWQPCQKGSQRPSACLVQLAVRTVDPPEQFVLLLVIESGRFKLLL